MKERGVGRAFGKAILLGEHAVVYGAPAIAAGLGAGARASARRLPPGEASVLSLGGGTPRAGGESAELARAFAALLAEIGLADPAAGAFEVSAESDLPPGGGLGSSAALGVAIARALLDLERGDGTGAADTPEREGRALSAASAWERVFHGNPSGIDTIAAARGGVFVFTRGEGPKDLSPGAEIVLCVGSTGSPSSTRAMVEGVAALRARDRGAVDGAVDAIAALSRAAAAAFESGDLEGAGRRMDENQVLLADLGVSTPAIERMCALARKAGALGAKLTGAGGGGAVIALVRPRARGEAPGDAGEAGRAVLEAWRDAGFTGFATRVAENAGARRVEAS